VWPSRGEMNPGLGQIVMTYALVRCRNAAGTSAFGGNCAGEEPRLGGAGHLPPATAECHHSKVLPSVVVANWMGTSHVSR